MDDMAKAWAEAEAALRAHPRLRYHGIGVALDGPGYVAWVGHNERDLAVWSHNDPSLAGATEEASPADALRALAALLRRV